MAIDEKYQLVIFDFDGVLADSMEICCEEINKLRSTLYPMLPEAKTQEDLATIYCGPLRTSLRRFGMSDEESHQFFNLHSEAMRSRALEISPFTEVVEVLVDLAPHQKAIVTSAYSDAVRTCLNQVIESDALDDLEVVGREAHLPKSKKFESLMSTRGVTRERTLTIGDTVSDILYAKDTGLSVCSVGWGYHPADYLSAFAPTHLAQNPKQLNSLLRV